MGVSGYIYNNVGVKYENNFGKLVKKNKDTNRHDTDDLSSCANMSFKGSRRTSLRIYQQKLLPHLNRLSLKMPQRPLLE